MNTRSQTLRALFLILFMTVLAACGSDAEPSAGQEPAPAAQTVIVVVTATTQAATEANAEVAGPPVATDPAPIDLVPACATLTALRLRTGPGEIYDIISNLPAASALSPQAFVARGFPAGSWLLVNAGSQQGWVSANPQFVSCNVEPASLPPASAIPPTPTAVPAPTTIPPTPTAVPVAALPISVGRPSRANDADPGQVPPGRVEWELSDDNDFLFRLYIYDLTVGSHDGDGIEWVHFVIQDENGDVVHQRREGTAGYCVFGGGEPNCNTWAIESGEYRWRSTGLPVVDGTYQLTIFVKPTSDDLGDDFLTLEDGTDVWAWFLEDFPVDVP